MKLTYTAPDGTKTSVEGLAMEWQSYRNLGQTLAEKIGLKSVDELNTNAIWVEQTDEEIHSRLIEHRSKRSSTLVVG